MRRSFPPLSTPSSHIYPCCICIPFSHTFISHLSLLYMYSFLTQPFSLSQFHSLFFLLSFFPFIFLSFFLSSLFSLSLSLSISLIPLFFLSQPLEMALLPLPPPPHLHLSQVREGSAQVDPRP